MNNILPVCYTRLKPKLPSHQHGGNLERTNPKAPTDDNRLWNNNNLVYRRDTVQNNTLI